MKHRSIYQKGGRITPAPFNYPHIPVYSRQKPAEHIIQGDIQILKQAALELRHQRRPLLVRHSLQFPVGMDGIGVMQHKIASVRIGLV